MNGPASKQNLTFETLEKELQDKLNIKKLSTDILKILNLYSEKGGYNNAAELIADENNFYGIDIVRFGKNIDEMMERKQFTKQSIDQITVTREIIQNIITVKNNIFFPICPIVCVVANFYITGSHMVFE